MFRRWFRLARRFVPEFWFDSESDFTRIWSLKIRISGMVSLGYSQYFSLYPWVHSRGAYLSSLLRGEPRKLTTVKATRSITFLRWLDPSWHFCSHNNPTLPRHGARAHRIRVPRFVREPPVHRSCTQRQDSWHSWCGHFQAALAPKVLASHGEAWPITRWYRSPGTVVLRGARIDKSRSGGGAHGSPRWRLRFVRLGSVRSFCF